MFQEVVKILFKHLKHQARMVLVLKALVRSYKVELIGIFLAKPRQYADLDLSLSGIRWMVFEDLDGDDLIGTLFPTLDDLAESTTSQKL